MLSEGTTNNGSLYIAPYSLGLRHEIILCDRYLIEDIHKEKAAKTLVGSGLYIYMYIYINLFR